MKRFQVVTSSQAKVTLYAHISNFLLFTVCNEVAKVMFLHLSVSHSVHRGVCLSTCWDTPPRIRPPWDQAPPPGPDTPLGPDTPQTRHTPPPREQLPRDQTLPQKTAAAAHGTHPTGMHPFLDHAFTLADCIPNIMNIMNEMDNDIYYTGEEVIWSYGNQLLLKKPADCDKNMKPPQILYNLKGIDAVAQCKRALSQPKWWPANWLILRHCGKSNTENLIYYTNIFAKHIT